MPKSYTVSARLLAHYRRTARDLPWRRTNDPYEVLVSEVMLQQTQASRVTPAFERFVRRFPTLEALAAAPLAAVLREWSGLGYNRRARDLHRIARAATNGLPSTVADLDALPGIGAYTARAVAAFAYGRRAPVVDTNVRRVVARAVHGAAEAGPPSTKRDLDDVEALLPDGPDEARAARFSAALMELGALVCIARKPRCDDCPLFADCAWQKAGRPAYTGPTRPTQRYSGTDRHVRGLLLDVLRGTTGPVEKAQLDLAWPKAGQRDACLASLLSDGLVEQTADGRFALPGEH